MTDIVGKLWRFCHTYRHGGIDYSEYIFCLIEAQLMVLHRIETMFKLADGVEKRVAPATGWTENLTQAILAKALRGELVPTEAERARREGRAYESASELLAKIKEERELKGMEKRIFRNKHR